MALGAPTVAGAADGFDQLGVGWVELDAFAELGDLHVECNGIRGSTRGPSSVEQRVAVDDLAGAFMQEGKDGTFTRRKVDLGTLALGSEFQGINDEVSHGKAARRLGAALAAAKHGANPGEKFAFAETAFE
jgi:hypothetical protein